MRRESDFTGDDFFVDLNWLISEERWVSCNHLIDEDAKRPGRKKDITKAQENAISTNAMAMAIKGKGLERDSAISKMHNPENTEKPFCLQRATASL